MPDDDDYGEDPFKTENRSWPDAEIKGRTGGDIFREDRGRESVERREPPERPPDKDDD
jgi:hypothetical protein